jgi:RNA polymerase sigma-70 factor (ECF subfamily)
MTEAESGQREFSQFYELWREPLRRALALTLGDVAVADEAVDEAMTRALSAWVKVGSYERPEGWVYRVGLNWARDVFRKRRYEILKDVEVESVTAEALYLESGVIESVGRLSVRLRSIVVARYYLDWSTVEVAKALDIPEGTVKSRLARALDRLAQELGEST